MKLKNKNYSLQYISSGIKKDKSNEKNIMKL